MVGAEVNGGDGGRFTRSREVNGGDGGWSVVLKPHPYPYHLRLVTHPTFSGEADAPSFLRRRWCPLVSPATLICGGFGGVAVGLVVWRWLGGGPAAAPR
ncbi:hypothetical protein HanXRQr2_Chr17g0802561 [Helianthus annuus]|uniref:Uncharacterized protein n=1 Tax=Helianthus annuus TaxID=4232 RepID=A0A251RQ61_HELAN|nr:hypothetical protein HanXRQr2_Chr17g0802561 [Helianthus annuus]KAJ0813142.1 hypothetical protein HanPSC8_Chr17g0770091 [Helianthus annuus]